MTSKYVEPLRPLGRGSGTLISPASAARWLIVADYCRRHLFLSRFLGSVLAALVIAFASWPVFRRLRMALGGNKTVAAIAATASAHIYHCPGCPGRSLRRQ